MGLAGLLLTLCAAGGTSAGELAPPTVGVQLMLFGQGAARARGAKIFADSGCAHCHGENGIGGGRGPDLRDVGDHLKRVQIREQIEHGGMIMPGYGKILSSGQINDLVAYLRAHRDRAHPVNKPPQPSQ